MTYVADLQSSAAQMMMHQRCAQSIARHLATYAQMTAGLTPQDISGLPAAAQERFRRLAGVAMRNTDPERREAIMASAVAEIEEWANGPYMGRGSEPSPADIAREAIARFCALELK